MSANQSMRKDFADTFIKVATLLTPGNRIQIKEIPFVIPTLRQKQTVRRTCSEPIPPRPVLSEARPQWTSAPNVIYQFYDPGAKIKLTRGECDEMFRGAIDELLARKGPIRYATSEVGLRTMKTDELVIGAANETQRALSEYHRR